MAFSDVGLRSLKAPLSGQIDYWDTATAGFGIRCSQGGSRTFLLKHRNRRITIGRFPLLSLSQARQEAKRLLAEFTLGRVRPQSLTYKDAVTLYLEDKAKSRRSRTIRDYGRLLGRVSFGQLADITHDSVAKVLKPITAPQEYNHLLVALRIFFNWCIKRRYITHNPTSGLSTHSTQSRARTLSDHEIKCIWQACEANRCKALAGEQRESLLGVPPPLPNLSANFCTIVQILILCGQRKSEIAGLRADNIQNNLICLKPEQTKNGRPHDFPMGVLASTLVATHLNCPLRDQSQKLLFPASKRLSEKTTVFNGWSKSKSALDKASGVKDWTLHDLRRTYASNLAQLGVRLEVIEKLLNHVSGSFSGVAGIYQRYDFMEEMRAAVNLWEKRLQEIVG